MTLSDFDLAAIYRDVHERMVELAGTLDDDQLATQVPTCPAWTVQDTYAHLSGLAADAVGGMTGRLGSPENTARHVAARRDRSIEEICREWTATGPAMEEFIVANNVAALAIDAWTHAQDIHNALGMEWGRHGAGLELTMSGVWRLKRQFREQQMAGFRIVTGDHDWVISDGPPTATLRIAPYELARVVLGRRSRAQMAAYDWEGDSAPYVAMLPVFTPPENDIVE